MCQRPFSKNKVEVIDDDERVEELEEIVNTEETQGQLMPTRIVFFSADFPGRVNDVAIILATEEGGTSSGDEEAVDSLSSSSMPDLEIVSSIGGGGTSDGAEGSVTSSSLEDGTNNLTFTTDGIDFMFVPMQQHREYVVADSGYPPIEYVEVDQGYPPLIEEID